MAISSLEAVLTLEMSGFRSNIRDAQSSIREASGSLNDMGDAADGTSSPISSLKDTLVGFAKVAAGAFAVDKIKDFAVGAVEAAAEAAAVTAQFEQVFGDSQDAATKAIGGMAEEFGMLPNRIKPAFTQTTAQFKGLGLDTEKAMEQAGKATTLAADAAAFYDKSMEDTQGSLNSFIKGNYEGGEAIGLFANETQMAAFAIKNNLIEATDEQQAHAKKSALAVESAQAAYGKAAEKYGESSLEARKAMEKLNKAVEDAEAGPNLSNKWSSLSEAQKQVIRLNFAEEMYAQSGATGQAARESEGYENVMGNLRQAWTDFQAVVGEPMLEVAIAGLQGLAGMLQSAGEWVKSLNLDFSGLKEMIGNMGSIFSTITDSVKNLFTGADNGDLIEKISGAIKYLGFLANYLKEDIWSKFNDGNSFIRQGLSKFSDLVGKITSGSLGLFIEAVKQAAQVFTNVLPVAIDVAGIALSALADFFSPILDVVLDLASALMDELIYHLEATVIPAIQWFGEQLKENEELVEALEVAVVAIVSAFIALKVVKTISALFQTLTTVVTGVKTAFMILNNLGIGGTFQMLMGFASPVGIAVAAIAALAGVIFYLWNTNEDFRNAVKDIWKSICDFFSGIGKWFSDLWEGIVKTAKGIWDKLTSFFKEWGTTIIGGVLLGPLGIVVAQIAKHWDEVKAWTIDKWNKISKAVGDAIETIKKVITVGLMLIESIFNAIWDTIKAVVQAAWNIITTTIENAFNFWTTMFENFKKILLGIWKLIWDQIGGVVQPIIDSITGFLSDSWTAISDGFNTAWTAISDFFVGIWDGFSTAVSDTLEVIGNTISEGWEAVSGFFTETWTAISTFFSDTWESIAGKATEKASEVSNSVSEKWTATKNTTSAIWDSISGKLSEIWNGISQAVGNAASTVANTVSEKWNSTKEKTAAIWDSVKNKVSSVWESIKQDVSNKINAVKDVVGNIWEAVSKKTSEKWNAIKEAISKPINAAKDVVKKVLDAISNWFKGLKLEMPSIKMPKLPKFNITGKFSLNPPQVPKLDISWFATGGIATGPSVVGIGEAGDEAILPLSNKGRMKPFAQAVSSYMKDDSGTNNNQNTEGGSYYFEIPVSISGKEVARETYVFTGEFLERAAKLSRKFKGKGGK